MIDANSQFFAILTNVGMAKQANADALGLPWKFTEMGVGDANNTDPIPSAAQIHLINEWRRRPLNQVRVDPVNPAVIIAEQIIPADEGGHWIREIGLYDADGDLVAVANCAPSFKPVLSQGSGRTQVVRMNFIVSSTGNITLKIDPAVVLATREYVDLRIMEELYKLDNKQSVRVATTANIALAGLQVLDGVTLLAGDRVLVKNQTVAKDNGIYIAGAPAWVRAPDADTNAEVTSALLVSVEQGTALADTRWQLVTDGVIVLGTTALTFQNVTQGFAPINSPALIDPTANTPALFNNSKALATTEFVQRALGSFSAGRDVTGTGITLPTSDIGQFVGLTLGGVQTVALPLLADVPLGATITLHNPTTSLKTITVNGADKLSPDGTLYTSTILYQGDTVCVTKEAGVWRLHGMGALKYSWQMSASLWTTQPQFTNDKSFATTEFVQRALGSFSGYTPVVASRVLTVADIGKILWLSSAGSYTLTLPTPTALGLPDGASFNVFTTSASGVVSVGGAATIQTQGGSIVTSVSLKVGQSARFVAIGVNQWLVTDSTAGLDKNADFAGSLGATGYQKLPSGDVDQWGLYIAAPSGSDTVITLPVALSAAPTNIQLTFANFTNGEAVGNSPVLQARNSTAGNFTVRNLFGAAASFFWRVRGKA